MGFRSDHVLTDAAAVTPSDTTAVDFYGLFVGGAGDVAVTMAGGGVVTLKGVAAGVLLQNLRVVRVMATNTTATNIVGLKA